MTGISGPLMPKTARCCGNSAQLGCDGGPEYVCSGWRAVHCRAVWWGVDAQRMQGRLDTFYGTTTWVPQGGVLWVFALRE